MKPIRRALLFLSAAVLVASAKAQPAVSPDLPVMDLDELGIYAVGYAYRSQAEQQFPLGWSGFFEDRTGVACEPFGAQNGERAFLLHCPWRNGTGVAFQQFVIRLPAGATRILLRGATAMRSQNVATPTASLSASMPTASSCSTITRPTMSGARLNSTLAPAAGPT